MFNPPQKLKFKKLHKIRRKHISNERSSNLLKFGMFGLQALEYGKLTARQIEAVRVLLRRGFRKHGDIKINVFPGVSLTKKPVSARMGKGKGKPSKWVAHVFRGKVLYEMTKIRTSRSSSQVSYLLGKALYKLPLKSRVVFLKY